MSCYQDTVFNYWYKRKDELLNSRIIEYTWVSRHLNLEEGSILNVGCGASWFDLDLALQGFDVTAVDTHYFNYGFKYYKFIQGDAEKIVFDKQFDRILLISTLEHIGIQQHEGDWDKDIKTVKHLEKFLKDDGLWIVTVPFGKFDLLPSWRIYNQERLKQIFPKIVKQESFKREGNFWVKVSNEEAENLVHVRGLDMGLSCLVAKK